MTFHSAMANGKSETFPELYLAFFFSLHTSENHFVMTITTPFLCQQQQEGEQQNEKLTNQQGWHTHTSSFYNILGDIFDFEFCQCTVGL